MDEFSKESGEAVIAALLSCRDPEKRLGDVARRAYTEGRGGLGGVLDRSCGEVLEMLCGRLGSLLATCMRENERLLKALAELGGGECARVLREAYQALIGQA